MSPSALGTNLFGWSLGLATTPAPAHDLTAMQPAVAVSCRGQPWPGAFRLNVVSLRLVKMTHNESAVWFVTPCSLVSGFRVQVRSKLPVYCSECMST
jgi:hypothetical protein